MRVLLVAANREHLPDPVVPLGALHVATVLAAEHDVSLLDLCFEPAVEPAIAKAIQEHQPQLVGLSIRNLNTNLYDEGGREALIRSYAQIVAAVRAHAPGVPIVVGGSGFSLQPTRLMERLRPDVGVIGEGENAARLVVRAFAEGRGADVPTLVWSGKGGFGGDPVDLPSLGVTRRSFIDPRHFSVHGIANVQTKRGCAFRCDYCTYPELEGRSFRVRDPRRVVDDFLDAAGQPGVQHVFVVDSVFNSPIQHAMSVCKLLEEAGNRVPWTCYSTPAGFNDRLVEAMARAGCAGVEIGSDSGEDTILQSLKKPFLKRQIVETRRMFQEHGVSDAHTFILGTNGESFEQSLRTLDFVEDLDPDVAIFMIWAEDRERLTLETAKNKEKLLQELQDRARRNVGWVVPHLELRFSEGLVALVRRAGWKGPSWLTLAKARRRTLTRRDARGIEAIGPQSAPHPFNLA